MSYPHHSQRFEQFQSGSSDAFDYYYDLYVERMHFYIEDKTGDRSAATDLTQEVFFILYKEKEKIQDESHLRAFLYTTAKNLSLKWLREKSRQHAFEKELAFLVQTQNPEVEGQLAEQAKGQLLMGLRASWQTLSPRKRRIIGLYFWNNRSTAEIAALLGIEAQTVRNHLSQSIILLRKRIDGGWEEINLFYS